MSVPAQIRIVVRLLPVIKERLWASLIYVALAQKKEGHKMDLGGEQLQGLFLKAGILVTQDQQQVVDGLVFLVTQASRPGLTDEKLQSRLAPLGFDATKSKLLWHIIHAPLEPTAANDSDSLVAKALDAVEAVCGEVSDDDEGDDEWDLEEAAGGSAEDDSGEEEIDSDEEEVEEDEDEADEDSEEEESEEESEEEQPQGPLPLPEMTEFVSKLDIPMLKRLLRGKGHEHGRLCQSAARPVAQS